MKNFICFLILLAFSSTVYGQNQFSILEKKLKSNAGMTWSLKIDTTIGSKKDLYGLSLLDAGNYYGRADFRNWLNAKHHFTLVIFETNNDSLLFYQIDDYYSYASCRRLHSSKKYPIFEKNKIDNLVLFLPMYPCFRSYSQKEMKLMKKLAHGLR